VQRCNLVRLLLLLLLVLLLQLQALVVLHGRGGILLQPKQVAWHHGLLLAVVCTALPHTGEGRHWQGQGRQGACGRRRLQHIWKAAGLLLLQQLELLLHQGVALLQELLLLVLRGSLQARGSCCRRRCVNGRMAARVRCVCGVRHACCCCLLRA
jgi:hypothetical protein